MAYCSARAVSRRSRTSAMGSQSTARENERQCEGLSARGTAQRHQLREQRALRRIDLLEDHRDREPLGAVDLGEFLTLAGLGRPFERERVAAELRRVTVAFHRPGVDDLATALRDRRQRDERALGSTAGLLLELAPRGRERLLFRWKLTLGNRPGPFVFPRPERTARVHQENLELTVLRANHQETGALPRHSAPFRVPPRRLTGAARY